MFATLMFMADTIDMSHGEVAEWFNAAVLGSSVSEDGRARQSEDWRAKQNRRQNEVLQRFSTKIH